MIRKISLSIALHCLLIAISPAIAAPIYTSIGTATNSSNPSAWQTYQFDVSQYIPGATSSTLYFDLRNDSPATLYHPDSTTTELFFGVDPDSSNYFTHFEYLPSSDTNHYRNVWLDIDGVKYVDQYGPFNDHLGHEYLGTSWMGNVWDSGYNGELLRRNAKGEIGTSFDITTYLLSQLIEVTTETSYVTETIVLGDTFSFDYWWKMGQDPDGFNLDILFFRDNSWHLFGGDLNFDSTSSDWDNVSFQVPDSMQGLKTQIRFSVHDLGDYTDPIVYLRNIASNSTAPVPEPATILLLGTGIIGLAGFRNKIKK